MQSLEDNCSAYKRHCWIFRTTHRLSLYDLTDGWCLIYMANALLIGIMKNFEASGNVFVQTFAIDKYSSSKRTAHYGTTISFSKDMDFLYYAVAGYEQITEYTVTSAHTIYPPNFVILTSSPIEYTPIGVISQSGSRTWSESLEVTKSGLRPHYIPRISDETVCKISEAVTVLVGRFG